MTLEKRQLALLPEPQTGCAAITPQPSSVQWEHWTSLFSKPTSTRSLVAEQRGINLAAAPSTEAGQREGVFPKVTAFLLCPKHLGKLSQPVASFHGSVPSCNHSLCWLMRKQHLLESLLSVLLARPCASIVPVCLQASCVLHLYWAKLNLALGS